MLFREDQKGKTEKRYPGSNVLPTKVVTASVGYPMQTQVETNCRKILEIENLCCKFCVNLRRVTNLLCDCAGNSLRTPLKKYLLYPLSLVCFEGELQL